MPRLEVTVDAAEAGRRLDALLAGRPEIGSRAEAARLLRAGRVSVDARARPKSHRLGVGERVVVELSDPGGARSAPDVEVPHAVVYEDEHVIVVDKPAGVVVHPAGGTTSPTLAEALVGRAAGGPPDRRGIVHRLDRDTSGLLVVAKSEAAHSALTRALRRREVQREYLTLVEGVPGARTATIDAPLGRDRADRTVISTRSDRPRAARTHFEVRDALARTALLVVRLETGRTHQIRAHLAAIGHPVVGDARYAGQAAGRRLGIDRQFLHSARLTFEHPATGEETTFVSPLPSDLDAALHRARQESPA